MVASLAEAWIEMRIRPCIQSGLTSLPSRKRGLKSLIFASWIDELFVASLAEAWIEISCYLQLWFSGRVASLAEAWIEMSASAAQDHPGSQSLPSRKRGLK